jgi:small conductance mechanosensitive channel
MENEIKSLENIIYVASEIIVAYGFQFVGAIIILLIGWQIAKWVSKAVLKVCEHSRLEITLSRFFSNIAKTLVLVFVVIIAMGKFGITIAPFIAALGAIALGSTLALQVPLSNYGAGLSIILTRPFVVGDTIKIQGVTGVVDEIKLAYTQLSNEDGEVITIPNKEIAGQILKNSFANLVVETTIGISYKENPEKVINIIKTILSENAEVAKDPEPLVGIQNFGDSAIEIGLRYWIPTRRYYAILYTVNRRIYKELTAAGITIPYPQREIHMISQNT